MPDNPNSIVQILPYAIRRKRAMELAGVGSTELQDRINSGRYRSFLDGALRYVVTQSIIDDQANKPAAPLGRGSGRRGRPRKTHT